MDLWQLNIFCKVIEHKSFSKAGKAVHLSQPTISSHIKDLEDHFDCRLIDRLSKEAIPTKAGAGVSIISTLAVAEDLQAGKFRALEVDGLNLKRNFYLTRHRYRSPSPLSWAFVKFLEEKLPNK